MQADAREHQRQLIEERVLARNLAPGNEYWYVPGELLVHPDDAERVGARLRERRLAGQPEQDERRRFVRFRLDPDGLARERTSVPELVDALRYPDDGPELRVDPNYALHAVPISQFGPGVAAKPARAPRPQDPQPVDDAFRLGILDTGMVVGQANPHPDLEQLRLAGGDVDDLDLHRPSGELDFDDAHGLFIADIVRRRAPRADIRVARVLLGGWRGIPDFLDELERLLTGFRPQVVNLSLGTYTHDNLVPFALDEFLRDLDSPPVIVAAAGNDASRRHFYPAAHGRVIGVGAVDGNAQPASFTNRGHWVDACAPGVDVHGAFVAFSESTGTVFDGWATWGGTSFAAPLVAAEIMRAAMAVGDASLAAVHEAATATLAGGLPVPDLGRFVR
jgi:hypothetical protein